MHSEINEADGLAVYLYNAQGHDTRLEPAEVPPALAKHQLLWVDCDLRAPNARSSLAQLLQLPAALTQSLSSDSRVVLETYGPVLHVSVATAPLIGAAGATETSPPGRGSIHAELAELLRGGAAGIATAKLDFLIARDWIATVRDADIDFLNEFRGQDKAQTMIGALTPASLAASLLDWHLESYFAVLAQIEAFIDRLDDAVIAGPPPDRGQLAALGLARRHLSRLRVLLQGQRSLFHGLTRPVVDLLAGDDALRHFQQLSDRYERLLDAVDRAREVATGSFELFSARADQDTNQLVKVLTFVTVLEGTASAIAGVFGMNFDFPFLHTGFAGFLAVSGGMVLTAVTLFFLARRRGWL